MRYRLLAAAPIAACCVPLPAFADTTGVIRGVVTFQNKPVAGVTVSVRGEQSALSKTTDTSGSFIFPRVTFGAYTVSATTDGRIAFSSIRVATDGIISVSLALNPFREIGSVTTTLQKEPGAAPVSVNTLTRAQIAAMPQNQSLDRLIETMPGIVQFSYDEPVAHGFHGLTYELDGGCLGSKRTYVSRNPFRRYRR